MVLIRLRHTEEIKQISIKEANILIRAHKAYLVKPSITVKAIITKATNEHKLGNTEIEYSIAKGLEEKESCIITEWMSEEEIKKIEKSIKKEIKEPKTEKI